MAANLDELLARAEAVLAEGEASGDVYAAIERYTDAFAEWFDKWSREGQVHKGLEEKLFRLKNRHAEVLKRAETLSGELKEELRALKKRGKGILTYADSFPKQIGSIKPRRI